MTTERQRTARRANGRLGGRPGDVTGEQARARELARRLGRKAVPSAVRLWTRLVAGRVRGATMGDRVRAAENLCDRFGAPRRAEQDLAVSDAPPKLVEIVHYPPPPGWNGNEPAPAEVVDDEPRELPSASSNGDAHPAPVAPARPALPLPMRVGEVVDTPTWRDCRSCGNPREVVAGVHVSCDVCGASGADAYG